MSKKRRRHSAEQIIKKLRDADAMLASGKSVGEVLQSLEVSEATLSRWRSQYGGMKSEEAKRLKSLEEKNARLTKIVADQVLDISMLVKKRCQDQYCSAQDLRMMFRSDSNCQFVMQRAFCGQAEVRGIESEARSAGSSGDEVLQGGSSPAGIAA